VKTLLDIVSRAATPAPWSEGDNIPWNDPGFSERMLVEHLSQDHEMASRTSAIIDEQVDWIFATVLEKRPSRLLDLGCGPGLYVHRLATHGCECVGLDFSPASIRHAREVAASAELSAHFEHADVRDADFGEGFDLVMMIYGQINVFRRDHAAGILRKAHAALRPGGKLLLEVQSAEEIRSDAAVGPGWYSAPSGLFSERPHLVLREEFWNEETTTSTTRFMVIDASTGGVTQYALSNEAYSDEEFDDLLRSAAFGEMRRYPSLRGDASSESSDLPVIVATR
jgi:SAM-dependent methyltransferase